MRKDAKAALAAIEKIIQKTFANEEIKIEAGVPLEKGLQHLCEQLGGCIPPDDHPAIINLKRLARTSNSFFLVSKDVVKRERLSHTLKAYGKIMFLSDENEFIANYAASAPNAVFVDPLSLQDHHHKLLGHLKKDHDPYAHIIGVGQSPQAHDLIKYKTMGLDGYIIWPGEHDALMKYISRIPTLTSPAQTSISLRSTGK